MFVSAFPLLGAACPTGAPQLRRDLRSLEVPGVVFEWADKAGVHQAGPLLAALDAHRVPVAAVWGWTPEAVDRFHHQLHALLDHW